MRGNFSGRVRSVVEQGGGVSLTPSVYPANMKWAGVKLGFFPGTLAHVKRDLNTGIKVLKSNVKETRRGGVFEGVRDYCVQIIEYCLIKKPGSVTTPKPYRDDPGWFVKFSLIDLNDCILSAREILARHMRRLNRMPAVVASLNKFHRAVEYAIAVGEAHLDMVYEIKRIAEAHHKPAPTSIGDAFRLN